MKKLDKTAEKCLIVTDEKGFLIGTITDGDIRRSILKGVKFSENISGIFNQNPTFLVENDYTDKKARALIRKLNLNLIPIVSKNMRVKSYVTRSSLHEEIPSIKLKNEVPVVIMAGGKGTRMEPFTKVLPKPLIPVNGKPIIEHIIERFTDIGCDTFYISVNYKSRIIKAYFDELNHKYKVDYINEKHPLGTAGSLSYLTSKINQPFFVTNCDIIIKSDYSSLYEFHCNGFYDLTLVASTKEFIIPYGTCELNKNGDLKRINEKPNYDFLINTGLYIINPEILKIIPKNKFYHITDLIKDLKKLRKKVGVFPIDDDSWIDIGQWAEYKRAINVL